MTHEMPSDNVETPVKVTIIIDGPLGTQKQEFRVLPSNMTCDVHPHTEEDLFPPSLVSTRSPIRQVDVSWEFLDLIRQPATGHYLVTKTKESRNNGSD